MAAAGPASWCREMKLPSFVPENAAGTPGWLTRKVCISETRRHPRVHHDAPRRDCLGCTGDEREGALSPTLACSRDKTRMSAAHSHASHPHPPGRHRPLAGALVPRAPSPARRRRRGAAGLRPLVPSLPHVPEPLRRCDSAFVPRSRDTRRREQLTPQRLRARYANDVATTTRIPAAERHLRLPRTLPGRAVRTPGPPPRA